MIRSVMKFFRRLVEKIYPQTLLKFKLLNDGTNAHKIDSKKFLILKIIYLN